MGIRSIITDNDRYFIDGEVEEVNTDSKKIEVIHQRIKRKKKVTKSRTKIENKVIPSFVIITTERQEYQVKLKINNIDKEVLIKLQESNTIIIETSKDSILIEDSQIKEENNTIFIYGEMKAI